MATIQYFPGNAGFLSPTASFDITSVVAKRVGSLLNYYSFDTDGTMFVLHARGVVQPDGSVQTRIVGWDHFNGADLLQSASADLSLQPFLTNMASRNPSSSKAMALLLGGNDVLNGSDARDVMVAGAGDDTLSGGAGADRMSAGAGQDYLNGGLGKDVLTGGAGADHFVFASAAEGGDKIADFVAGLDHIDLSASGFGLAALVLGENFILGTQATAAMASLIYNPATGVLAFDADGSGAGAAVTLATLAHAPVLSVNDLLLF